MGFQPKDIKVYPRESPVFTGKMPMPRLDLDYCVFLEGKTIFSAPAIKKMWHGRPRLCHA